MIWSGGSAWLRDDGKETAGQVAEHFCPQGYAVAGVSVRSSAQARFPAQLEDGKAAVSWLRTHADEHGLDPGRFAFMGNSSGGWVATMTALTAGVGEPGRVQAAVDLFGPTDFLQMDAHMVDGGEQFRALLGIQGCHDDPGSPESRLVGGSIEEHPDACARANPIAYVTSEAPPFLIVHGQTDPYVPHHQSELLFEALRAAGATAVFYLIPEMGHEYPYLADETRAAGYVTYSTSGDEPLPPPTWAGIEAFIAGALPARTVRWLPALVAAAYLINVALELRSLVRTVYWNSDAAAPFVLGETLRGHGHVFIPHYGSWTSLWWLLVTRDLPGHAPIWEGDRLRLRLAGSGDRRLGDGPNCRSLGGDHGRVADRHRRPRRAGRPAHDPMARRRPVPEHGARRLSRRAGAPALDRRRDPRRRLRRPRRRLRSLDVPRCGAAVHGGSPRSRSDHAK